MTRVEYFNDDVGGVYVAIIRDGVVTYTASGLEREADLTANKYIPHDGAETLWERGDWQCDGISNEETYKLLQVYADMFAAFDVNNDVVKLTYCNDDAYKYHFTDL